MIFSLTKSHCRSPKIVEFEAHFNLLGISSCAEIEMAKSREMASSKIGPRIFVS